MSYRHISPWLPLQTHTPCSYLPVSHQVPHFQVKNISKQGTWDIPLVSWFPRLRQTRSGHIHFRANAVKATSTVLSAVAQRRGGDSQAYRTRIHGRRDLLISVFTVHCPGPGKHTSYICQLDSLRRSSRSCCLPLNTIMCFSDGSPIFSKRFTTSKNCCPSAPTPNIPIQNSIETHTMRVPDNITDHPLIHRPTDHTPLLVHNALDTENDFPNHPLWQFSSRLESLDQSFYEF
jgi:hypothetical protein